MKKRVDSINTKLDKVLKEEKNVKRLEKLQLKEINSERKELKLIHKEESKIKDEQFKELEKLKELEREISKEVGNHPLRKLSYKDAGKSMIGAFIGIVSHFTVLEGVHFAEKVSSTKASFLFLVSFGIGLIMLYYTGFRKIKDPKLLVILPLRLFLVYSITIIAIVITMLVFDTIKQGHIYSQIAVLSLPAIIGACAADLIGGE
ncbi:MAG: DUF2391 family protein [Nanoarchaeota archaeon]